MAKINKTSTLRAVDLSKSYGKRAIFSGVNISVKQGESIGLLGPNGAGKTTCFYCITGQIAATGGQIFLDSQDITSLPFYQRARLKIGYLPQENSIFRGLSVEDNIMSILEVSEKDSKVRKRRLDELLKEFSISHLRKANASSLSGGERRRVEIARTLTTNPKFILLDEPFAGIDPIAVADIRELVAHLKNRGLGVIITDHNVRETLGITDRSYILHNGRIIKEGSTEEIVKDPKVRSVYLGEDFRM
ncbi:MAG: LPS export ABC transporter ATP-binding protein [Rickettsiales bacterium]|jgi:lipopolysaccharide export system ATP-binding protein|nr:LPS export ABC transporter ATP-binding protein [Rickettsiales bacterium]